MPGRLVQEGRTAGWTSGGAPRGPEGCQKCRVPHWWSLCLLAGWRGGRLSQSLHPEKTLSPGPTGTVGASGSTAELRQGLCWRSPTPPKCCGTWGQPHPFICFCLWGGNKDSEPTSETDPRRRSVFKEDPQSDAFMDQIENQGQNSGWFKSYCPTPPAWEPALGTLDTLSSSFPAAVIS